MSEQRPAEPDDITAAPATPLRMLGAPGAAVCVDDSCLLPGPAAEEPADEPS